jgi:hypothetical protein
VVEVLIEEMFGSDRSRPRDYRRAVVIDTGPKNKTNEDTLRSERRSALKKRLTQPTLLEMSGKGCSTPVSLCMTEIAHAAFEGNEEAIYKALCKMLLKGNPRVLIALAERAYGKLREPIELSVTEELAERLAALRKRKSEAERESRSGLLVGQSATNVSASVSEESPVLPSHGAATTCAPKE